MIRQTITCDHCGAEVPPYYGKLWRASFLTVDDGIDDVHGCSNYHLALGVAKALGLDVSPKLAELQAQLDKAKDRIASLETAAKMNEATIEKLNARIAELTLELNGEKQTRFLTSNAAQIAKKRFEARVAELEKQLAPVDVNGKTPAEVFVDEYEQRRNKGVTWNQYSIFDRALIRHGCNAVLRAFGHTIAAKALADMRNGLTLEDDPTGYFRAKIDNAIEQLQGPKAATLDHVHELGSCTHCEAKEANGNAPA